MSRLSAADIAQCRPRRGVRVTTWPAVSACVVACGHCDYVQVVRGPKAAAEEQARFHRGTHRKVGAQ